MKKTFILQLYLLSPKRTTRVDNCQNWSFTWAFVSDFFNWGALRAPVWYNSYLDFFYFDFSVPNFSDRGRYGEFAPWESFLLNFFGPNIWNILSSLITRPMRGFWDSTAQILKIDRYIVQQVHLNCSNVTWQWFFWKTFSTSCYFEFRKKRGQRMLIIFNRFASTGACMS